jgi:hypothetical protein
VPSSRAGLAPWARDHSGLGSFYRVGDDAPWEDLVNHTLDIDLYDAELNTEIQLLAELMVLGSESVDTLDRGTIDAVLGVRPGAAVPAQRQAS